MSCTPSNQFPTAPFLKKLRARRFALLLITPLLACVVVSACGGPRLTTLAPGVSGEAGDAGNAGVGQAGATPVEGGAAGLAGTPEAGAAGVAGEGGARG